MDRNRWLTDKRVVETVRKRGKSVSVQTDVEGHTTHVILAVYGGTAGQGAVRFLEYVPECWSPPSDCSQVVERGCEVSGNNRR